MSETHALRLEGVERRYGRGETTIEVLNGAELTLKPGESVALIAPSGAGKSTLLHIAGRRLSAQTLARSMSGGATTAAMNDESARRCAGSRSASSIRFHHLAAGILALLENIVLPQMIAEA